MIIPLRTPEGLPDVARLDEWATVCDRCRHRTSLREATENDWLIGQRTNAAVYCPPCVYAIAKALITGLFPAGLPHRVRAGLARFFAAVLAAVKGVSA